MMKFLNMIKITKRLLFIFIGLILLNACDDDDAEQNFFTEGDNLTVEGENKVKVGDVMTYNVYYSSIDPEYDWTIESGASISEDELNDGFVDVTFSAPGQ